MSEHFTTPGQSWTAEQAGSPASLGHRPLTVVPSHRRRESAHRSGVTSEGAASLVFSLDRLQTFLTGWTQTASAEHCVVADIIPHGLVKLQHALQPGIEAPPSADFKM